MNVGQSKRLNNKDFVMPIKGMPRNYHRPIADRLEERSIQLDGEDACRIWTGGKHKLGYGLITMGSRTENNVRTKKTHRIAYECHIGPIPDGMSVCHKCDNPPCIRPSHLFLGTHKRNMEDREEKGRGKRPFGDSHHATKLTTDAVLKIRHAHASGTLIVAETAKKLGVGITTIWNVIKRKNFKHIP